MPVSGKHRSNPAIMASMQTCCQPRALAARRDRVLLPERGTPAIIRCFTITPPYSGAFMLSTMLILASFLYITRFTSTLNSTVSTAARR